MSISRHDRQIIEELVSRVNEIAGMPEQQARKDRWHVKKRIRGFRDWGVKPKTHGARPYSGASFAIDPVINDRSDLDRLNIADLEYDSEATLGEVDMFQELLNDLLPVKLCGIRAGLHLMQDWNSLRGPEQTLIDMAGDPVFFRAGISIIAEGYRRWYIKAEKMNLLSPPTFEMYQAKDLATAGNTPENVRMRDLMVWVDAQELTAVSPAVHKTFCIDYEKPLAEMFGLATYGCCEDLTDKAVD